MTPTPSHGLPTVVQFGAGAIGRGFVGQLWADAGYEVVFVDVDPALVDALNARRAYPLRLLAPDGETMDRQVGPVRAVDVRDRAAVAAELARCAFACSAAGVNAFQSLGPTIAAGIVERVRVGNALPLNVLCCENQARAGALLRAAVAPLVTQSARTLAYFENDVAFVDASVGRMVPPATAALIAEDRLLIAAEPYAELPIDGAAWIGPVPPVPGLLPKTNFDGYTARKRFTHNGGHAVLAYHGYRAGFEYIHQAADDPRLTDELAGFWGETGRALIAEYGFDPADQHAHETDLLARFRNRALGDTITRVARDPIRKLRADDRLAGAALFCLRVHPAESPEFCARALAAALRYDYPGDPAALEVQGAIAAAGVSRAVAVFCGIPNDSALLPLVVAAYEALG